MKGLGILAERQVWWFLVRSISSQPCQVMGVYEAVIFVPASIESCMEFRKAVNFIEIGKYSAVVEWRKALNLTKLVSVFHASCHVGEAKDW